jgi:hypothetical protein
MYRRRNEKLAYYPFQVCAFIALDPPGGGRPRPASARTRGSAHTGCDPTRGTSLLFFRCPRCDNVRSASAFTAHPKPQQFDQAIESRFLPSSKSPPILHQRRVIAAQESE